MLPLQLSCRASLPPAKQPPARAASWQHLPPHRWSQRHLRFSYGQRPGFCCALEGEAPLPLPAHVVFALLTHPGNPAILRALDRCTRLSAVAADGSCGRTVLEVEQESTISFLGFRGRVSTPLLVEQDEEGLMMRYRLAQRGEGCGHLNALEGCWRVVPDGPASSLLRVEQAVQPRGLPPLVAKAVRGFVAGQLRGTFEDLYAEAQRINAGRPTLPLGLSGAPELGAAAGRRSSSHSSGSGSGSSRSGSLGGSAMGQAEGPERCGSPACGEQEDWQGAGDASAGDPASVLDRLSGCSSSTSDEACTPTSPFAALCHSPFQWEQAAGQAQLAGPGGSTGRCSASTIPAGAQLAAGTTAGPASHPLSLSSLLSDASSLGCSDGPLSAGAALDSSVTDSHPPAALRRGAIVTWLAGWYKWLLEQCESLAASSEPHHGQPRSDSWAAATATAAMPVPGCL